MESWIESMGQNPQSITLIIVVILCIVAVLMLYTIGRMVSGRKDLDKERRALDAHLYSLEKFAGQKKKEQGALGETRPESFWPKTSAFESASSSPPTAAADQPVHEAEAGSSSPEDEEEDEFADIRRENAVKDWSG
ncbi:MAG: hypothetical protein JW759_07235 [Candidatus Coatesbacteria bacterium]|nr:hypothetical protein [Candidatus Coatesbacteria bacterium]